MQSHGYRGEGRYSVLIELVLLTLEAHSQLLK